MLTELTLGLALPYAVQPGLNLGVGLELSRPSQGVALVLQPRTSIYTRPSNHVSVLLGTDLGLALGVERPVTHTVALGAHYLASSQVESIAVDLSTGGKERTRDLRHHAVPLGRYTLGHQPGDTLGWYASLGFGGRLSPQVVDSVFYQVDLGVRIRL